MKKSNILLIGILSAISASVFAALPTDALAPLTTAGTDAATIGGAVLVLVLIIAGWKYLRRAG